MKTGDRNVFDGDPDFETVCPRRLDPFYAVSSYIKRGKTFDL